MLAFILGMFNQSGFAEEWVSYVEATKKKQRKRRQKRPMRSTVTRRRTFIPATKKWPQYAMDGKARAGCVSAATGRTEIDLTIYNPETSQVLVQAILNDKEGEQTAAPELLRILGSAGLPRGIVTGDAGITCPTVTAATVAAGHHYILGLKGNAGKVYGVVEDFPWHDVKVQDKFFNEGHGRNEIRTLRRVLVSAFNSDEFKKYAKCAVVFQVRAESLRPKDGHYTDDTRYFIGDEGAAMLSPLQAITYIRDHWQQESFHWVKDKVLGEDACQTKRQNGSRALGVIRSAVVKTGKAAFGSVKKMVDYFSANPGQAWGE